MGSSESSGELLTDRRREDLKFDFLFRRGSRRGDSDRLPVIK